MTASYPPPPPGPPSYRPTQPAHAAKTPWWKALWFVALVAAVVGIGIGAASAGSKAKTKTVAGPTTHATTTETATATSVITTTPTVVKTIATKTHTVTVTYHPPIKVAFTDGTFLVGSEIKAGTYHTEDDGDGCYYERDHKGDGIDAIIANDNLSGPTTITIASSDYSFTSSGGCSWVRK